MGLDDLLAGVAPILDAAAVYADAIDCDADRPLWWTATTFAVGYLFGPVLLALFLVIYLVLHALEDRWERGWTGAGV